MEKIKNQAASMENIYSLDGKVPFLKSIPFGLQHVLAMFVGNIAPIMIVTGASGLSVQDTASLIQTGHDHGRYRHPGAAVHRLEAGRKAAHRHGYQLYLRFCLLLCGTPVGL